MNAMLFHDVCDIRLDDVAELRRQRPTDAIVRLSTSGLCSRHRTSRTLPIGRAISMLISMLPRMVISGAVDRAVELAHEQPRPSAIDVFEDVRQSNLGMGQRGDWSHPPEPGGFMERTIR